jgi:hypothetical protein
MVPLSLLGRPCFYGMSIYESQYCLNFKNLGVRGEQTYPSTCVFELFFKQNFM